jgi:hypothetical protein
MEGTVRSSVAETPAFDLSPTRKSVLAKARNSCVDSYARPSLGPSSLRESLKRNSNAPVVSGGGTVDSSLNALNVLNASELKQLTFNSKTTTNDGLTRKHIIAMDGHIGHGRSLS